MSIATCDTCTSFSPDGNDRGECRKNPPILMMVPVQTLQGVSGQLTSMFPVVSAKCWCAKRTIRLDG